MDPSPTPSEESGSWTTYVSLSLYSTLILTSPLLPQIGEISIMKDMTSVTGTTMTEEEKAEIEKQMSGGNVEKTSSINKPSTSPIGGASAPTLLPHQPDSPTTTRVPPAPQPTTPPMPTSSPSSPFPPDIPRAPSTTSLVTHPDAANASPSPPTTAAVSSPCHYILHPFHPAQTLTPCRILHLLSGEALGSVW